MNTKCVNAIKYLKMLQWNKVSINKILIHNVIIAANVAVIFICLFQKRKVRLRVIKCFPQTTEVYKKELGIDILFRVQVIKHHTFLHPLCNTDLFRDTLYQPLQSMSSHM